MHFKAKYWVPVWAIYVVTRIISFTCLGLVTQNESECNSYPGILFCILFLIVSACETSELWRTEV